MWRKEGGNKTLCGILMDPSEFLPKYVSRLLARQEMEGCLPAPGFYKIMFKVCERVKINARFCQLLNLFLGQVGSDGGRHGWFKWANGPVPEGTSLTQSISLCDCMIISISSLPGTPEYEWKEERSNSDKRTRVLGEMRLCYLV